MLTTTKIQTSKDATCFFLDRAIKEYPAINQAVEIVCINDLAFIVANASNTLQLTL